VNEYGEELSRRNRWVAGALAILLGAFGVHRFYLGHTGWGLTQLLITVLSLLTLSWAVAIWAFVEGILCFVGGMRDIDGRPLSG
jgi:TM2 domain-containing membrane protein YozV